MTTNIGDHVMYWDRQGVSIIGGIVAETAAGPLTGTPRVRVVDTASEMADDEAGRWIDEAAIIRVAL
ncbi:MAG: hypothetical protein LC130_10780 [Bryobacterales bacterium]|nr:hypothetical protein [Bryobacterales bacterium]